MPLKMIPGHVSWLRIVGVALGLLLFAAAGEVGALPREWMFRYIVRLVGLGLVLVFAFGGHIDRLISDVLARLDRWILRRGRRAGIALAIIILAYAAVYGKETFLRHYYFDSGYDLAIQDQVVWNTSQGSPFGRSLEVTNDLGDHVRLYLGLLSLIYLAAPSPYVLLAFQSVVLGLSAWPLYRLARRKLNSPAGGLVVAASALAYPALGFLNLFDFHSEVLAVPLLIAAYERIDAEDLKSASLFLGLALLTKENIAVTVAALGLLAAFSKKYWRFGLTWASAGAVYFLIAAFVIIPTVRGAPSDTLQRYQWLGDTPVEMLKTTLLSPGLVFEKLTATVNVLTCLQLLVPLAFLPLLALPALLPALPTLFYNFMSAHFMQATIYHQYMASAIPFMYVGAVSGLYWLVHSARGCKLVGVIVPPSSRPCQGIGLGLGLLLLAAISSWTYENPIEVSSLSSGRYNAHPNDAAIRAGLTQIPENAHVLTTSHYFPHLSHRPNLGGIPRAPVSALRPGTDAIFVNLRDLRRRSCDDYRQTTETAARLGFGVTFYREGVLLIQEGKGNFEQLKELVEDWPGCA